MARANNGGWDFVKVGGTYQYKEDGWIAMVTVIEDKSNEDVYEFVLQTEKATDTPPTEDGQFDIMSTKKDEGYYSGMLQLYEQPEYECNYKWQKTATKD